MIYLTNLRNNNKTFHFFANLFLLKSSERGREIKSRRRDREQEGEREKGDTQIDINIRKLTDREGKRDRNRRHTDRGSERDIEQETERKREI